MNRLAASLLAAALGTAAAMFPVHTEAATSEGVNVFESAAPVVVFIIASTAAGEKRTGSGVILGQDEVLTNCHVVEGSASLGVTFFDGKTAEGAFAGRYGSLDLCQVTVPTLARRAARNGHLSDVRPGMPVYAVGSPLGLKASISSGIVSSVRSIDDAKLIQTTAPISPGSSGGGLFDKNGLLLGITTSSYTRGQNVNFAIPIDYTSLLALAVPASGGPLQDPPSVTFKGLPFGLSREDFLKSFPSAVCETRTGVTCSGSTDLFGRPAEFTVFFGERGLYLAYFRIYDTTEKSFQDAISALVDRFGWPPEATPGVSLIWKWTDSRKDQFLGLTNCTAMGKCINEQRPGIQVYLADFRFKAAKRNDF